MPVSRTSISGGLNRIMEIFAWSDELSMAAVAAPGANAFSILQDGPHSPMLQTDRARYELLKTRRTTPRKSTMTTKPFDIDRIFAHVERTVVGLRRFPQLLLPEQNLKSACLFLAGFDAAFGGAALAGLDAWLILRVEGCREHARWMDNLPRAARMLVGTSRSPTKLLAAGCQVLERFLAYRRRYGVRKIMVEHMDRRRRSTRHKSTSRARQVPGR